MFAWPPHCEREPVHSTNNHAFPFFDLEIQQSGRPEEDSKQEPTIHGKNLPKQPRPLELQS